MINPVGWTRRIALWAGAALLLLSGAARVLASELAFRGILDLVESPTGDARMVNWLHRGNSTFDSYRLRAFAEGNASDHVQVFTQLHYDDTFGPMVIGAYAMWTPDPARDVHVIAGKIPWMVGTWQARTYSNKNPLIGMPMMYQYHTTLLFGSVPRSVEALLEVRGQGQAGVVYGGGTGGFKGMPMVYDFCWDFGAMATGSLHPVEFALGFTNNAPSVGTASTDFTSGKNLLGRVGISPAPWVRLGTSGSYGNYLAKWTSFSLPAGKTPSDYRQLLLMGDAEFEFEHAELRAEGYLNKWPSPYVGDLKVHGGYVEAKYTLPFGLYAAGRAEVMRFSELQHGTVSAPWDYNRSRLETGLGYRAYKDVILKFIYQRNRYTDQEVAGIEASTSRVPEKVDFVSGQVSLSF